MHLRPLLPVHVFADVIQPRDVGGVEAAFQRLDGLQLVLHPRPLVKGQLEMGFVPRVPGDQDDDGHWNRDLEKGE